MNENIVILDVREDLRCGHEPFSKIMDAVAQLQSGGKLQLTAPFKPTPLFAVLGKLGFDHQSKPLSSGDWEVLFTRRNTITASMNLPERAPCTPPIIKSGEKIEVDARGLEPPQPMIKVLEALAVLPAGAELVAHTDRRPMHLYAQLEERGYVAETLEQKNGSFITKIRGR